MIFLLAAIFIGLIVGLILSYVAFEELEYGREYFHLAKRMIMLLFFIAAGVLFLMKSLYFLGAMFLVVSIVILYLELVAHYELTKLDLLYYLFFLGVYFILFYNGMQKEESEILVSLIFLYGVPVGTLLHLSYIEYQTRKEERKKKVKKRRVNV